MATPRITGRIEVLSNGTMLLNKPGAKAIGIGKSGEVNYERKPVRGDTGIHGYIESPIEARCEVTITDRDDVSLDTLAKVEKGTVIFRSAGGGKSYTLVNATCQGNFTITGGEGETPVVFIGDYWIEATT